MIGLQQINNPTPALETMTTGGFPAGLPQMPSASRGPTIETDRSTATQDFTNIALNSQRLLRRQASNPQFQRLNMAPYLKESRDFVKQRHSSRGANRSSLEVEQPAGVPLTARQDSKSTLQAGVLTTTHSKPILSVATGLAQMTPLGPALGSVRSFSRSKVEQHSAR